MKIKCFLLEPTERQFQSLRRFTYSEFCPGTKSGHAASVPIEDADHNDDCVAWPRDDPRWPTRCSCGYVFQQTDEWQLFSWRQYRRADTGEVFSLHPTQSQPAPSGALWFATWFADVSQYCGLDGKSLIVRTPAGDWMVDSRANNCTLPNDNEHKCWCRHGDAPNITVDKVGLTCAAGAGSIQCGNYHGFLRDGYLVD